MEVINDNKCVAQGAAAWQEKETREQVMRDLESVHGYVDSYFQINGYVYVWAIQELPLRNCRIPGQSKLPKEEIMMKSCL